MFVVLKYLLIDIVNIFHEIFLQAVRAVPAGEADVLTSSSKEGQPVEPGTASQELLEPSTAQVINRASVVDPDPELLLGSGSRISVPDPAKKEQNNFIKFLRIQIRKNYTDLTEFRKVGQCFNF